MTEHTVSVTFCFMGYTGGCVVNNPIPLCPKLDQCCVHVKEQKKESSSLIDPIEKPCPNMGKPFSSEWVVGPGAKVRSPYSLKEDSIHI